MKASLQLQRFMLDSLKVCLWKFVINFCILKFKCLLVLLNYDWLRLATIYANEQITYKICNREKPKNRLTFCIKPIDLQKQSAYNRICKWNSYDALVCQCVSMFVGAQSGNPLICFSVIFQWRLCFILQ